MLNLYKTLDVDVTASQSEIISASEKLIEEWDPSKIEDRKSRAIVAGVLREILDARDVLTNTLKRREYDVSIGLADIVYKESSESGQNMGKDETKSTDYTTQVHIPTTEHQEIQSDAEEFYDSSSTLTPDEGTAELKVNLKEATSSDPYVKVYKTGSDENKNERESSQPEHMQNETNVENLKVDDTDGKRKGSLEKVNGTSEQNESKLENQQSSAENTNSKVFNEKESNSVESSNFQNSQVTNKDSESVSSSKNSDVDVIKEAESASVNDSSKENEVADVSKPESKDTSSNKKEDENSNVTNFNTEDSVSATKDQNSNVTNSGESKTLDDVAKQESETNVVNEQDDKKNLTDSLNTNEEENQFNKSVEVPQLGTENNIVLNLNKDALQNSLESQQENSSPLENKNDSNSKNSSKDNFSQNVVDGNKTKQNSGNQEKATELTNGGTTSADNETTTDSLSNDTINTEQSKIELNSEENEISSESQNGSSVEISNDSNHSEILNGSAQQDSSPKNRFSEPVNPTKTGDQSRSEESSIKEVLSQIISKVLLNSEEKKSSKENESGSNSETASEDNSTRVSDDKESPTVEHTESQNLKTASESKSDDSNKEPPTVEHTENPNLKTTSESKSDTFITQSKDSHSKSANGNSNTNVTEVEQSNANASEIGNFSSSSRNEFEAKRSEDLGESDDETKIFTSETLWKSAEQPKATKENPASKKPNYNLMKSVSASTRSRGSETKTVYFFGPDDERVEVYVDGKMRVQVSKGESENSYTSDWQNSSSPSNIL